MTSPLKILVVSYGGGHAAAVAPVVAALRREGQCDVVALGWGMAAAGKVVAFMVASIEHRERPSAADAGEPQGAQS